MSRGLYDIYTLVEYSNNGFGIGVVSCSPGDSPYKYLAQWFEKEGFKFPLESALRYRIVDREEDICLKPGIISVGTYYDGAANYGRARPSRGGFAFDEGG